MFFLFLCRRIDTSRNRSRKKKTKKRQCPKLKNAKTAHARVSRSQQCRPPGNRLWVAPLRSIQDTSNSFTITSFLSECFAPFSAGRNASGCVYFYTVSILIFFHATHISQCINMYLNYLLSFCVRFFRCATHTHTHTHTADTDLDAFVQKNARAIYIIYPPYPPIFDPQKWCKNRKIPMGR